MLLPPTGRSSSGRQASGRTGTKMTNGLVQDLRLSGRVIRPKTLDELFDLMNDDELKTLMCDLKEKKKQLVNLHDQEGSKEERLRLEAARTKLDEALKKVEQYLGVPSGSKDINFDGLQEKAASEMRRLGKEIYHADLRLHCFMHVWAIIYGLRTKFAQQKDLPDFLPATLPHTHKEIKQAWDGLRRQLFSIYIKSDKHDCSLLPRVIVAIPDFHFLRERIHDMARANSLLDMSDDFGEHLNGCFIAINDPNRASKAQLELLQESIRDMSARKAMQVVRAEQLMDRKEQEGSLKRLRTGLAKHEEASIVCKDTEESLCAMLRAACHLRQGYRLNNSSSSELVVVPIMRPPEGGIGSTGGASTSKQAAKHQRLSAVIPEGYSYRFVLLAYNLSASKQGLDSIRTYLELKWQERPGEMDIAALKEESQEEREWKQEMRREAEERMDKVVATIRLHGTHLPYLHLLHLVDNVEHLKQQAFALSAAVSNEDQRALRLRIKEREKESGPRTSSFKNALHLDDSETFCRALRFHDQDDSWKTKEPHEPGRISFERS